MRFLNSTCTRKFTCQRHTCHPVTMVIDAKCHVTTMLRRLINVFIVVCLAIVKLCRSVVGIKAKRKVDDHLASSSNKERKSEWEEWEMTDVKVESTTPSNEEVKRPDESDDLFKDMAPVIHATKKIKLKGHHDGSRPTPNLNQFAFDPTFTSTTSELLEWSDEEAAEGWDGNEDSDLPTLLRQSRRQTAVAGRKKRETVDRQTYPAMSTTAPHGLGATRLGHAH